MSELEIIGAPQSTFVWQVRIGAEEKGTRYAHRAVRPHDPEVAAIHPFGLIPVMRHGDFVLGESRAIAAYIDASFDGPPLFPEDIRARAITEQWVSLANNVILPKTRRYVFAHFFARKDDGEVDQAEIEASLPDMQQSLRVLDENLTGRQSLVDGAFTFADAALMPQLHYMSTLPESTKMMSALPALSAYFERHRERPSFVKTTPPPFGES